MVAFSILLLSASLAQSASRLEEEGLQWLQRLASQGYGAAGMRVVRLEYLEPCTLSIYLPDSVGAGFFMGIGGDEILDLYLEADGAGWILRDTLPDDFPVIRITAGQSSTARFAVLCAMDMLHDATADSALFMYALERVDLQPSTGDVPPAQAEIGGVQ
jgi:hypothetical protein